MFHLHLLISSFPPWRNLSDPSRCYLFSIFKDNHIGHSVLQRFSLLIASIPYALVTLATGFDSPVLLVASSVLAGVAAALLWTAHGHLVTSMARVSEIGLYSGVFFGLFKLNGLVGNLLLGLLRMFQVERWLQFFILTVIAIFGTSLLLLIR